MAPRGPRRSHRPRVIHTSSDEDELMTGLPTSFNGHGSRLPIRAQAAPMEEDPVRAQGAVTTDELSTRDQRSLPVRAREAATTDGHGQRPSSVRAREAVTTDGHGQRPSSVRAREAATTDELSRHAHRAPTETQPAYDPEAASSTMQDSDEDSDPEIREAQREFHELRRQRKLATVQLKVQRERDLLAQLRGRLTESARPESSRPESDSLGSRGEKRSRSDTTLATYDRPPPKAAMESRYKGKNMREFTTFTTRLENHFRRYAEYFTSDKRKVAEGVSELSDPLLLKWAQHEKDEGEAAITWQGFYEFLLRLINDPINLRREASQNYTDARQKVEQSVRDFAAYMAQWEVQLQEPYTENQRKEHLRTRVLTEIRREALKYKEEPESYEAFVAHLQTVENSLPTRMAAIRDPRRDSNRRSTRHDTQKSNDNYRSRSRPHSDTTGRPRDNNLKYCNYCKRYGHIEPDCRIKKRDTERDRAPKSKN